MNTLNVSFLTNNGKTKHEKPNQLQDPFRNQMIVFLSESKLIFFTFHTSIKNCYILILICKTYWWYLFSFYPYWNYHGDGIRLFAYYLWCGFKRESLRGGSTEIVIQTLNNMNNTNYMNYFSVCQSMKTIILSKAKNIIIIFEWISRFK